MGFLSPNLERRGRLLRFWTGLIFLLLTVVTWILPGLFWITLMAGISTAICWIQSFSGWCVFKACKLRSAG